MCQISQNEMIQRASSELLCNLVQFGEVADLYKGKSLYINTNYFKYN